MTTLVVQPVADLSGRIVALDILRGFALRVPLLFIRKWPSSVSWAVFRWALPHLPVDFTSRAAGSMMRTGPGIVSDQWLTFTYIGALLLLLTDRPQWIGRLAW